MIPLAIAPDLMEEAVLLAERQAPPAVAHAFRLERDAIYEIVDPDRREAGFHQFACRWFTRFGLRERLEGIIGRHAPFAASVAEGRVVRAVKRSAEGADLVDVAARHPAGSRPLLVVRLLPESLLAPDALAALLAHELRHVADMLDPAFGYERTQPESVGGPLADNLLRDRYRVVWDVTIDGRIARASSARSQVREPRWQEFKTTFAALGDGCADAFDYWWTVAQPTHAGLLAFAAGSPGAGSR
jgi:hypothetical protein